MTHTPLAVYLGGYDPPTALRDTLNAQRPTHCPELPANVLFSMDDEGTLWVTCHSWRYGIWEDGINTMYQHPADPVIYCHDELGPFSLIEGGEYRGAIIPKGGACHA